MKVVNVIYSPTTVAVAASAPNLNVPVRGGGARPPVVGGTIACGALCSPTGDEAPIVLF
jgi:hypothetical protein